jgi:hypothetical protein
VTNQVCANVCKHYNAMNQESVRGFGGFSIKLYCNQGFKVVLHYCESTLYSSHSVKSAP